MKYKYLFLIAAALVFFFGWTNFSYLQEKENDIQKLRFIINSSKSTYVAGEIVNLTFNLVNESDEEQTIMNNFNTEDGYLNVYISQNGKDFGKYVTANWGTKDTNRGVVKIKPDESIETSARIFWNGVPSGANLSKLAKYQLVTNYAFPKAGNYYVKATFTVFLQGEAKRQKIESEPIEVTIEDPVGDDLKVWNKIKDRGDLAYFIQEGNFRTSEPEEKEKLKQEVEQIFNQNPESLIAKQIGKSLENFKVIEEKSKAYLQKLREAAQKKP